MARFHPFRLTYRYAHHYVLSRKTATKSTLIDAKVLIIQGYPVLLCKLRLFFERWTIADAVHKVEPIDPLSDTQPSPVTSNAWCRLLLWPLSSRPVQQCHHFSVSAHSILRAATVMKYVGAGDTVRPELTNVKRPQTVPCSPGRRMLYPIWVKLRSN